MFFCILHRFFQLIEVEGGGGGGAGDVAVVSKQGVTIRGPGEVGAGENQSNRADLRSKAAPLNLPVRFFNVLLTEPKRARLRRPHWWTNRTTVGTVRVLHPVRGSPSGAPRWHRRFLRLSPRARTKPRAVEVVVHFSRAPLATFHQDSLSHRPAQYSHISIKNMHGISRRGLTN